MSKLFWQLPWAGPMRGDDPEPEWAVMPSPGLGDAKAVCVPVTVQDGVVALALADDGPPIPLVPAPLGRWTTVVGERGPENRQLCLLGYDQPAGGVGDAWILTAGVDVTPADVRAGLARLQQQLGARLAAQVLDVPAPSPASAASPARAAAPSGAAPPGSAPPPVALTLAFASCQYPSGLMDGLPAQASLQRLAALFEGQGQRRPERLLLLGDQIYADATAGLLDPIRLDDKYRAPYEELMQLEPLRAITRRIPVSWMLDDHEIADNWEPDQQDSRDTLLQRGLAAYWTYQRKSAQLDRTWRPLHQAGWHLFMADTRTCRPLRCEATLDDALILGLQQTEELETWLLGCPSGDLKLVATPAMLLPRVVEHLDEPLHLDSWQGYPASLARLLAFLWDHRLGNVCFLSGDAHLGCDVAITLTGPDGTTVSTRSIHSPALYAPLPFANEQPWNLKLVDSFTFRRPQGQYHCEVRGSVFLPHRDGCCLLQADRIDGAWDVTTRVV